MTRREFGCIFTMWLFVMVPISLWLAGRLVVQVYVR